MAQIPLNKFRREFKKLSTYSANIEPLYICPSQRATIILSIQAANISSNNVTVSVALSSSTTKTLFHLVSGYGIPKNDAANMALGKVLMTDGDGFVAYASDNNSIDLTVSLLEAYNAD